MKVTQIRISDELGNYVDKIAKETGASMNSVMCMLMLDGKRMREATLTASIPILNSMPSGLYPRYERHGKSDTRLYGIWRNILSRCNKEYDSKYDNYGGRGVDVCDEWKNSFMAFYDWAMKNGYEDPPIGSSRAYMAYDALTIDRIDGEKGYCPDNCRWITFDENRRLRTEVKYGE